MHTCACVHVRAHGLAFVSVVSVNLIEKKNDSQMVLLSSRYDFDLHI